MENITNLEKDIISRNRIVSESDTNFFVEAGAGSGKTTMLVNRMVAMVEAGTDISKICAITFTKAAAGEFYERFQKLLIERSNPEYVWKDKGFAGQLPQPTELTRQRCAMALRNIDMCFMGTIDAFCNMVLSEHPFEAQIPSDSTIVSDVEAEALYKQVYVDICKGNYGEELKNLSNIFRGFHWNTEDVFIKGIKIFMANRNVHFNFNECMPVDIDAEFKKQKVSILRAFECLICHPEIAYKGNKDSRDAWEKLADAYKNVSNKWSNNFSTVLSSLKSTVSLRLLKDSLDTFAPSLSDWFELGGKKGGWLEVSDSYKNLVSDLENLRYNTSMTFLFKCSAVIENVMREKGYLTYFDYLFYLRNMLKEDVKKDCKLINYIYNRHSYFLIDEFQDTNPMQAEIFFYLTAKKPVDDWRACIPRPGSLFIVGDPKQSIYRFRSADVSSFIVVKNLFNGDLGEVLTLAQNFRSGNYLLNYFNRIFSCLLPVETKNQSKFEEIPVPDKGKSEFQGVFKYSAYDGKAAEQYPDETDPKQIAKIINNLVGNKEYLITTEQDKEPREIRYSDIMIISYGKSKLGPIMEALKENGISTKVEGEVPFYSNEALKAIYNIYAAVADVDDKIALYGALTGKLLNFSKEELMHYKTTIGKLSLISSNESDDFANHPVGKRLEELKQLHHRALKLSPAALFIEIMDKYEIFKTVEADSLEVLYYTLELIRAAESKGVVISPKDGADYLSGLINGNSGEERCLSLTDKKDCVHMANLHKVKGLEAPIVILAASTSRTSQAKIRKVYDNDVVEGYVFKLESDKTDGHSYTYFSTNDYQDQLGDENTALKDENDRLLYVAATRARNVLIISERYEGGASGSIKKDSKWNPLVEDSTPNFFEFVVDNTKKPSMVQEVYASNLYENGKNECVINDRTAEEKSYELKNPSRINMPSKISDPDAENKIVENSISVSSDKKSTVSIDKAHRFPKLLGTMVHRLMEIIVSTKGQYETAKAIDEILIEYRTPQNMPFESLLYDALNIVGDTVYNGGYKQDNGAPTDIIKTLLSSEECYTEVPFCYKEIVDNNEIIWNGVMDVVYKKDGLWHILDYKTNADGNDLDEKYKGQLAAYVKAFTEITGETVADALTYHIAI